MWQRKKARLFQRWSLIVDVWAIVSSPAPTCCVVSSLRMGSRVLFYRWNFEKLFLRNTCTIFNFQIWHESKRACVMRSDPPGRFEARKVSSGGEFSFFGLDLEKTTLSHSFLSLFKSSRIPLEFEKEQYGCISQSKICALGDRVVVLRLLAKNYPRGRWSDSSRSGGRMPSRQPLHVLWGENVLEPIASNIMRRS